MNRTVHTVLWALVILLTLGVVVASLSFVGAAQQTDTPTPTPNGTDTPTPTGTATETATETPQSVPNYSEQEVLAAVQIPVDSATERQVAGVRQFYETNRSQLSDLEQQRVEQWLEQAGVDTSSMETATPTETPAPTSTPSENRSFSIGSLVKVNNGGDDVETVVIDLKAYGHIYRIDYDEQGEYAWVYVKANQPATLTLSDGNDKNDGGVSRVFISTQTVPKGQYRYKVQTDVVNGRQCIIVNGDGTPADYGLRHCNADSFNLLTGDVPRVWIPYSLGTFLLGTLGYVAFWISRRDDHGEPESVIDGETVPESVYGVEDYLDEAAEERGGDDE